MSTTKQPSYRYAAGVYDEIDDAVRSYRRIRGLDPNSQEVSHYRQRLWHEVKRLAGEREPEDKHLRVRFEDVRTALERV